MKGVSFTIKEGEIVGYLGVNGAGKTTTIKILTGILYPDEGEVRILGKNPFENRREVLKQIGVVFGQDSIFVYEVPVIASLRLFKEIYRLSDEFFERRLNYLVELFDAKDLLNKQYRTLSLGQKMKVNLIAALLHKPKILFLDEPTIGLDIFNKRRIREIIKRLNKEEGLTVLITTHDMEDIEELCDRIILLENGKISYDGPLAKFKQRYYQKRKVTVFYSKVLEEKVLNDLIENFGARKNEGFLELEVDVKKLNEVLNKITKAVEIDDLEVRMPNLEEILLRYFKG